MDRPPVVVFTTASDVEASVVMGLLDSHDIQCFRASGSAHAIWPMSVSPLGAITVAVPEASADEARRIIESHTAASGPEVVRFPDDLGDLESRLQYRFLDRALLVQALTHRSRSAEAGALGAADNESLEFLGDAVLGLVVADILFHQYPDYSEGQKSKIKAAVVSAHTLTRLGETLELGRHLLLGRGEEKTGGRSKPALVADACEAVIAAMYLDGGIEAATVFLARELKAVIGAGPADGPTRDYKSALQEHLQSEGRPLPEYRVSGEAGPDHRKTFTVEVIVDGQVLGTASGRAKKEAEQAAARAALTQVRTVSTSSEDAPTEEQR